MSSGEIFSDASSVLGILDDSWISLQKRIKKVGILYPTDYLISCISESFSSAKLVDMSSETEVKAMEEKNDSIPTLKEEESKKTKKDFKWTPKRLEAFEKMRASLETKNELTKKLREEKSKKEKEDLKKRVREIMSYSAVAKEVKESKMEGDSNDDSSSHESEEETKTSKKAGKKKKEMEIVKKKRSKKQQSSSSEEESEEDSESSGEERAYLSRKKQEKVRKSKEKLGKAIKTTPLHNPMDRFILL